MINDYGGIEIKIYIPHEADAVLFVSWGNQSHHFYLYSSCYLVHPKNIEALYVNICYSIYLSALCNNFFVMEISQITDSQAYSDLATSPEILSTQLSICIYFHDEEFASSLTELLSSDRYLVALTNSIREFF